MGGSRGNLLESGHDFRYLDDVEKTPSLTGRVHSSSGSTSHEEAPSWLSAPIPHWSCVVAWCIATVIFVGAVFLLGGPTTNDSHESTPMTWAIANGQFECAFPASPAPIAPLYPLASGGIAAVLHLGTSAPFPSSSAMGAACDTSYAAINAWAARTKVLDPTLWIGCIGWLFLMVGVISLVRASGRGRQRWEALAVIGIASLPVVWMCLTTVFHPEDLMALGLSLAALACALRSRWRTAGILIACAVLSQQFALLVAIPLLVVAPKDDRPRFAASATLSIGAVIASMLILTSGRAARAILFGSGSYGTTTGGTFVWEMHLSGIGFVIVVRAIPVVVAGLLSWWVVRRSGPRAMAPETLIALATVTLVNRLAFEQGLNGYYFLATTVMLVMLDVVCGKLRSSVAAWLLTVIAVYCSGSLFGGVFQTSWTAAGDDAVAALVIVLAVVWVAVHVVRRTVTPALLIWIIPFAVTLVTWQNAGNPLRAELPVWWWQLLLVPWGLALGVLALFRDGIGIRLTADRSGALLSRSRHQATGS